MVCASFVRPRKDRTASPPGLVSPPLRPGDLGEVVGHDPPADPSPEAPLAPVAAAPQPAIPLQDVDPPLDPGAEPIRLTEPTPPLLGPPPRRRLADVRQGHAPDARALRQPLVLRRRQPPVGRQQPRRPAEPGLVVLQAVLQGRPVLAAAPIQDRVAADDAALDLVEPDLTAGLDGPARLGPRDHPGMRLE